jgi:hypothetical protein
LYTFLGGCSGGVVVDDDDDDDGDNDNDDDDDDEMQCVIVSGEYILRKKSTGSIMYHESDIKKHEDKDDEGRGGEMNAEIMPVTPNIIRIGRF